MKNILTQTWSIDQLGDLCGLKNFIEMTQMKNAIVFKLLQFIYLRWKNKLHITRDINIFDEGRWDISSKSRPHIEISETVISTILLAERSSGRDW